LGEELHTNRRKGSRDNLVRKGSQLAAAIEVPHQYRARIWENRKRSVPIRPEDRYLFVEEDGKPLTRSGFNPAWQRIMVKATEDGVITAEQRFGLDA